MIHVGRFETPKAHWHLLRAFKKIKQEVKEVKLVLLGEGGLRPYLEQLATDLGLREDVHLPGFQVNPYQFISRAKVLVLSSLWEGFPNVLVESMICGTPVVSTDCRSGPREILAPITDPLTETSSNEFAQYGILTPVMDENYYQANDPLTREESLFADAVITLLKDQEMRTAYAVKAQHRVSDFHKVKIMQEYSDIILR